MTNPDASTSSPLSGWIAGGLLVVVGLQVWSGWTTRAALQEVRASAKALDEAGVSAGELDRIAARIEKAAIDIEQVGRRLDRIDGRLVEIEVIARDWEFLVDDITRMRQRVDEIISSLEGRGGAGSGVQQPPELDWTQPDLFGAAQRAAETVGVTLTEDEVRIPARIVAREGILEYFAVLKGGKEHEALISLVGNAGPKDVRPAQFAAKINNAVQALGFRRGRPIRITASGTWPAEGQTAYLFVEWDEDGETVVVRAEDLVWNRRLAQPMPRDSWVYVGSSWIEGETPDELIFAADITAEVVATYSAVNTMFDTIAEGAQDDTVFLAATPRIPQEIDAATFVVRFTDREPTRTFPAIEDDAGDE